MTFSRPPSPSEILAFIQNLPEPLRTPALRSPLETWPELANALQLSDEEKDPRRIYGYYLPFLFWSESVRNARSPQSRSPTLIALSGPQGSGKSTLVFHISHLLETMGYRAISLSIDDFYLTHEEQLALAKSHPTNPYLQKRGYPGTHDIELGIRTLKDLKAVRKNKVVRIPRYDKSRHHGSGDRWPLNEWTSVEGPLDIIFFEGWMLGFTPAPFDALPNPEFREVNENLRPYQAWYDKWDAFALLKPRSANFVLKWRAEAEERMRRGGKPGMSPDEITAYISLFLPAYETYLPRIASADLTLTLDRNRRPSYKPD